MKITNDDAARMSTAEICDRIMAEGTKEDLEKIYERIFDEIYHDEEPYKDKAELLLTHYIQNPGIVDDVLVALCGWTMDTLLDMALREGEL